MTSVRAFGWPGYSRPVADKMKSSHTLFLCLALLLVAPCVSHAQDPDGRLLAAVKELAAQQVTISDNQTQINIRVVDLTEKVRVARIFMSRAGHLNKKK
jgi:hypothetical protein